MKNLVLTLGLFFFSLNSFAKTNCKGIQESEGLAGVISDLGDLEKLSLEYTDPNQKRTCIFSKDQHYKPTAENPKRDRYRLDKVESVNCNAKFIWASKSLVNSGRGYVDVEFACSGGGGCAHGEPGPTDSFICELHNFTW